MFDKVNINSSKALPLKPLNLLNIMELNSAKGNFKNNGKLPDTFQAKIQLEENLFSSLLQNTGRDIKTYIKNDKARILTESLGGFVLGAGIAALSKNPEILGETIAPLAKAVLPYVNKIGLSLATIYWSTILLLPAVEVWQNPQALNKAKLELDTNVSTGLVDYTSMGIGGLAGAGMALKFTPDLIPTAPKFDLKPALKLNETPKEATDPTSLITKPETNLKPDVVQLYESSFPKEERQPSNEVQDLVNDGRILVHTTRDPFGNLKAFSFVSLHDETSYKFAGLDFVATDCADQSKGIGSLHLTRLNEDIKAQHPDFVGMTLEMEHPNEPDLDPETLATRLSRAKFYDRLNAPNTNIKYNIIDFEDPSYRGMAEYRAFVYQPEKFNAVIAAHTFMTDNGGYQLSKMDKAVLEFNQANNFWQPTHNWLTKLASPMLIAPIQNLEKHLVH